MNFKSKNSIKCLIIFFLISCGYAQKYDPKTGKLIQEKQFDPKTGELIEEVEYDPKTGKIIQKENNTNELLTGKEVVVILTSGERFTGKLIETTDTQISISSTTLGSIKLQQKNVKNLYLKDSLTAVDNTSKNIFDDSRKLNESNNDKVSYSEVISRAKSEASLNNEATTQMALGATGCLFGAVGMPIALMIAHSEAGLKKPSSSYYNNLDDDNKKKYKTAYMNEAKKLRRNGVTGTMGGCMGIALFLSLVLGF